eukprot:5913412-Pleurochrysis_carterae.AAC.3
MRARKLGFCGARRLRKPRSGCSHTLSGSLSQPAQRPSLRHINVIDDGGEDTDLLLRTATTRPPASSDKP